MCESETKDNEHESFVWKGRQFSVSLQVHISESYVICAVGTWLKTMPIVIANNTYCYQNNFYCYIV